jgi:aspartate carbamoyltransferase regulatory subunit
MTDSKHPPGELKVSAIRNGTVIDHIPSAATFKVAQMLQVQNEKHMVTVGTNLPSSRLGRKGIIKIENRALTPDEVDKIALLAPEATINIISDYRVVDKFRVKLPQSIERVVRCFNPRCITNQQQVGTRFTVIETSPPALRCTYCERVVRGDEIIMK